MEIQSKGLKTDVLIGSLESKIVNFPNFCVIKTPSIPEFMGGNGIVFSESPKKNQDVRDWIKLYENHFDIHQHGFVYFTWDTDPEACNLETWKEKGFEAIQTEVLGLQKIKEVKSNINVTRLNWNTHTDDWIKLHQEYHWQLTNPSQIKNFWTVKAKSLQQLEEIFPGGRWVVLEGNTLIADVGIYVFKNVARIHAMMVSPTFQRKGMGGQLLETALWQALQTFGFDQAILIADPKSTAYPFYKKLGFQTVEKRIELIWKK